MTWDHLIVGNWYSYSDGVWLKLLYADSSGFYCSERIVDYIHSVKESRYRIEPVLQRADHYQIEHDERAWMALNNAKVLESYSFVILDFSEKPKLHLALTAHLI